MNFLVFAVLSAVFAALTSILAKIGIKDVNSNLATAIRTIVVTVFAWGIVAAQGTFKQMHEISRTALIFLVLSGLATGMSWLFYFRALQMGPASKVVPIDKLSLVLAVLLAAWLLKERLTAGTIIGSALITLGVLVMTILK